METNEHYAHMTVLMERVRVREARAATAEPGRVQRLAYFLQHNCGVRAPRAPHPRVELGRGSLFDSVLWEMLYAEEGGVHSYGPEGAFCNYFQAIIYGDRDDARAPPTVARGDTATAYFVDLGFTTRTARSLAHHYAQALLNARLNAPTPSHRRVAASGTNYDHAREQHWPAVVRP